MGGWATALNSETRTGSGAAPGTPGYDPAWYALTDIYWDPVSGSDSNAGTSGHPVKTFAEIVRRYGSISPVLVYGQNLTIHLLSSQTAGTDPVFFNPQLSGGTAFAIIGTPVAVGSTFHPSSVTAKNRATNTLLQVHGMPGGTAAGALVHNQTHDSYAFVDSIVAGVATMTQPFSTSTLTVIASANVVAPTEVDTWASTDTLQIYSLPALNLKALAPQGGDAADSSGDTPACWVQWVHVPDPSGTPGISVLAATAYACSLVYSVCWFDSAFFGSALGTAQRLMGANLSCWHAGGGNFAGWAMVGGSIQTSGEPLSSVFSQVAAVDGDAIIHGESWASGFTVFGYVCLTTGCTMTIIEGSVHIVPYFYADAQAWGAGTINVEHGANFQKDVSDNWATCLTVSNIQLDGATTGTSYSAGTFTDGRALSTANLDTYTGLQNVQTGSRYSTT